MNKCEVSAIIGRISGVIIQSIIVSISTVENI